MKITESPLREILIAGTALSLGSVGGLKLAPAANPELRAAEIENAALKQKDLIGDILSQADARAENIAKRVIDDLLDSRLDNIETLLEELNAGQNRFGERLALLESGGGNRWPLEDMQTYHENGGERDPKDISDERLARESREQYERMRRGEQ